MWVLPEGTSRAIKLRASLAEVKDLNDFAFILTKEVIALKDVNPQKLSFYINYEPVRLFQDLANKETDVNPLIVRYPISNANRKLGFIFLALLFSLKAGTYSFSPNTVKVTLMYGSHRDKYEIPHTSNSFDHLKNYAKEIIKIEGLEEEKEENIYFVNGRTDIRDVYNFNKLVKLVSRTANHNEANIKLKIMIMIKRRKKYSDWNIKDVFRDILQKPLCDCLSDLPRFNFDELPPLQTPITQEQFNKFIENVRDHVMNLVEIGDGPPARFIINDFLSAAVSHIQRNLNQSLRLAFEKELKGTCGYGPIDCIAKIIEIFVVLCEAKMQDMIQGIAQNIVQMHSAMELLIDGKTEPKMFGIVTTGRLWRFVCWTGSLDQPTVHISEQYICRLTGNFENEKKVVKYIAQILQAQVMAFDDDDNEQHPSKRLRTGHK